MYPFHRLCKTISNHPRNLKLCVPSYNHHHESTILTEENFTISLRTFSRLLQNHGKVDILYKNVTRHLYSLPGVGSWLQCSYNLKIRFEPLSQRTMISL